MGELKLAVNAPKQLKVSMAEHIVDMPEKVKQFGKVLDKLQMRVSVKKGFHIVAK